MNFVLNRETNLLKKQKVHHRCSLGTRGVSYRPLSMYRLWQLIRNLVKLFRASGNLTTPKYRGYITSSTQGGGKGAEPQVGGRGRCPLNSRGLGAQPPSGSRGGAPFRGARGAKPPGKFLRILDNFDASSST